MDALAPKLKNVTLKMNATLTPLSQFWEFIPRVNKKPWENVYKNINCSIVYAYENQI